MMETKNITGNETHTPLFEESLRSPVWVGEFKQQSISFSAVNILLSITAILGNSLILVALHKESSLHPPSKLLYRCLATTDLLVGLVSQPLYATYWMSVVHERLGCISGRWSIQLSQLHYNCLVRLYRCVILHSYLHCLVHKDFSHSHSSSGSSTRSLSTTAEPTKCYEHGRIQKGTVQCTVGAVSFSCLLYTLFGNVRCDLF